MSAAIRFNFKQSKILSSGNRLRKRNIDLQNYNFFTSIEKQVLASYAPS